MQKNIESLPSEPREFSLTNGGPLFSIERSLGLLPPPTRPPVRLVVVMLVTTWLPLIVLSVLERLSTGRWDPLILRSEVHIRLLGALVAFLIGEVALEQRCRTLTRQLARIRTIPREGLFVWQRTLARLAQIRDAWPFEALALGFIYLISLAAYLGWLAPWALRWLMPVAHTSGRHWSQATVVGWWYLVVSQPIFMFVFLRWLVRWTMFTRLMWCLAALKPRIQASHADRAGGLAFLASPLFALRFLVAGSGFALTAVWLDEIARSKAQPIIFAADFLTYLVIAMALSVLPYIPFTTLMIRAKHRALLGYSALVDGYVEAFNARWIDTAPRPACELLGHADFTGLADLGKGFHVTDEMRSNIPGSENLKANLIASLAPFILLIPANAQSTVEFLEHAVLKLLG